MQDHKHRTKAGGTSAHAQNIGRGTTLELTINGTPLRDWTCPICGKKGQHGFCSGSLEQKLSTIGTADKRIRLPLRYSGKKSKRFWRKIEAIKSEADRAYACDLAVQLQAVERQLMEGISAVLKLRR